MCSGGFVRSKQQWYLIGQGWPTPERDNSDGVEEKPLGYTTINGYSIV